MNPCGAVAPGTKIIFKTALKNLMWIPKIKPCIDVFIFFESQVRHTPFRIALQFNVKIIIVIPTQEMCYPTGFRN